MWLQSKTARRCAAAMGVIGGFLVSGPLVGQQPVMGEMIAQRTIRVSGMGEARARPDAARMTFAVETFATTAREAGQENARLMERVIQALMGAGVARTDITTSNYTVYPEYIHDRPVPEAERLRGYRATNQVILRTTQMHRVGDLIDIALTAGANRMDGVMFEIQNPEPLQAEALRQAVQRARTSAETIATALGVRLGPVLDASTGVEPVRPMPYMVMERMTVAAAPPPAPTPVEPGEQTVLANVTLVFSIAGTQ